MAKEHSRMSRELLLEKHNNPGYDELYSGRDHLDEAYNQMMDHDRDLNAQLNAETHRLYSKFHKFHAKAGERKKKRDRMLKKVLESATVENHFLGNVVPKHLRGNPKVSLEHGGIRVSDESGEIEKQKLMGMKNLGDLKGLNIRREIERRERRLRLRNKKYFQRHSTGTPEERKLTQTPVKMVKSVHSVGSQSFLLRNAGEAKGVFKPERGLRQTRRHARAKRRRGRKLAKSTVKKKKKKIKKKKSLKKKFKKIYKFNWKTLKWTLKKKYKYGLIKSMKDLKFWRAMGIKIKKHKVKLFYRWENNRPHKKGQDNCVLTARFSPMSFFWDVQHYYVKATFKSNCENYTVEKLFKSYHNHGRSLVIYIGNLRFSVKYHHQRYRFGWYNRQYLMMKVFPKFKAKTFNPFKKISDYVKFGLAPEAALKWKKKRLKLFFNHQHGYPLKTEKQAWKAYDDKKKREWKKKYGNRLAYGGRRLQQIEPKEETQKQEKAPEQKASTEKASTKKTSTQKAPKERKLMQVDRELRIHWVERWQNMWRYGYRDTQNDPEIIIVRKADNPLVSREIIKRLWSSTKYSITCHGSSHGKTCRI